MTIHSEMFSAFSGNLWILMITLSYRNTLRSSTVVDTAKKSVFYNQGLTSFFQVSKRKPKRRPENQGRKEELIRSLEKEIFFLNDFFVCFLRVLMQPDPTVSEDRTLIKKKSYFANTCCMLSRPTPTDHHTHLFTTERRIWLP